MSEGTVEQRSGGTSPPIERAAEPADGAPPGGPLAPGGPATPAKDVRVGGGVLPPIAYPLLAIVFGGVLVWSFSRILLTVDKKQAAAIALLMAMNILIGAALVAYGSRVRRRAAAFPLLLFAAAAIIVGGVLAFTYGDRPPTTEAAGGRPPSAPPLTLDAQGLKFVQTTLSASVGKVTIVFDNKDPSVPHNVVVFDGKDASAPQLFRGAPVTGPGQARYVFTASKAGTYFFHCEFHPTTMQGTLTVTPAGSASGGTGGSSGGLTVTAKNLAFTPTSLQAPGTGSVTIHFVNDDPSVPHNIVVFNGSDPSAPQLFVGQAVTGPGSADYSFPAPPAGTYFFHCEFHPTTMKGTIKVGA